VSGESRRERLFWLGLGILLSCGILAGYGVLLFSVMPSR
jgi:hypothetical protein